MGSALAFKHEKKKGKASAKSEESPESHPWEEAGAREGLPLFLMATSGVLRGKPVQARLAVNVPGDPFEQEADRVAESVAQPGVRPHSAPRVLRVTGNGGADELLNRAAIDPAVAAEASDPELVSHIQSPGGGRPLPHDLRNHMEANLGADFSQVRVHDNAVDRSDADRLNAKAFTHGQDIWIGSTGSAGDRKLMAHELTHVLQQAGQDDGQVRRQPATDVEIPESAPPETAPEKAESALPEAPAATPEPAAQATPDGATKTAAVTPHTPPPGSAPTAAQPPSPAASAGPLDTSAPGMPVASAGVLPSFEALPMGPVAAAGKIGAAPPDTTAHDSPARQVIPQRPSTPLCPTHFRWNR